MNEKIDITSLLKAQGQFEKYRKNLNSDQEKSGAVQAFEYCYELSWKMMKRVLGAKGLITGSPKDTFRNAAIEGLITNPEVWFEFQVLRNLTVHTYNEYNLNVVVKSFDQFSKELQDLISNIEIEIQRN
jgi:nucleotidyltransferase substrate binding protein (TIGR01987 family)